MYRSRLRYRHRSNTPMYYSRNPVKTLHPYTGTSNFAIETKDLPKAIEYLENNGYTVSRSSPPPDPDPPDPDPPVPPPLNPDPFTITSVYRCIGDYNTGFPLIPPPTTGNYLRRLYFTTYPDVIPWIPNNYYIFIDTTRDDYNIIRIINTSEGHSTQLPKPKEGQYITYFYPDFISGQETYYYILLYSGDKVLFYIPVVDPLGLNSDHTNDPDFYFTISNELIYIDGSAICSN